MRGFSFNLWGIISFCGVLVITLITSIGMIFWYRMGTSQAVRLGRVARLTV